MIKLDFYFFQKIHNLAKDYSFLDKIGIFFARDFIYLLFLFGLIYLFFSYQKKIKKFIPLILSVIFSRLIFTEIIRFFYYRPRPFLELKIEPLISHSLSGSFPSGHLAFFFPLAIFIYFANKKLGILFFFFGFLIGLARVFVGIHYPLDILGGIFLGTLTALIFRKFIRF